MEKLKRILKLTENNQNDIYSRRNLETLKQHRDSRETDYCTSGSGTTKYRVGDMFKPVNPKASYLNYMKYAYSKKKRIKKYKNHLEDAKSNIKRSKPLIPKNPPIILTVWL